MSDTSNAHCKNCGSVLTDNFCAHCGQSAAVDRITFKETLGDFINTVFSVDAPFVITLKLLLVNPGKLFREYLDGKRKTYYKAVPFFILMSLIHILIRSVISFDALAGIKATPDNGPDYTLILEAGRFMFNNINNFLFFFVFSLGLTLKIFFYKKYTLAEYIAVSFYIIGAYTILGNLNVLFMKFVNSEIQFLALLFMVVYVIYALVSFFKTNKIWVAIKGFIAYLMGMILYMILAFGLSFVIIWIKNN